MTTALIAILVLVVAGMAFEVYSRIAAKQEKARWNKMSPAEQRKYQKSAYRQQAYSSGI